MLAVLGGLRRGELSALRWNDNPRPGVLVVDEGVYRGKLGSPKTRKSEREVAIGEMSQRAINEWQKIAKFTELDHFMFGQRKNTPADLHNAIARRIKPVAVKLGIGSIGWHDLRHTFTTWGRLAGMKAETLRDQLGHSSVLTTLDIYSHAQAEAKRMEEYAAAVPVRQSLETVN